MSFVLQGFVTQLPTECSSKDFVRRFIAYCAEVRIIRADGKFSDYIKASGPEAQELKAEWARRYEEEQTK